MQQKYKHKQFTFINSEANSIAALDCILLFLGEEIKNSGSCKSIVLRSKWILTELFTNASKHSNDDVICFDITIENEILQITKSDCGEPISVFINNERKSFPADFNDKDVYLLHKDDLSILYAKATDNALTFSAEDNTEIADITVQGIHEHFGLIIIAKSSDEFIYTYDSCTKTNIFTVSLWL